MLRAMISFQVEMLCFFEDHFLGVQDTQYITPPVLKSDTAVNDWLSPNSYIAPTSSALPLLPSSDATTSLPATITPLENTTNLKPLPHPTRIRLLCPMYLLLIL